MSASETLNILVIPDKRYPLKHALLEHIFGRELPRRGHKITWLMESYQAKAFGERHTRREAEFFVVPVIPGEARLDQIINNFYRRPRGLAAVFKIVRTKKIDLVLVRNDVLAALLGWVACRLRGIPFVYYLAFPVQEMALEVVKRGWTRSRYISLVYARLVLPLRDWITRQADYVFTMSDYWRAILIRDLEIPPERVSALPFGFDISVQPNPEMGSQIRCQFGLGAAPLVFYMGTIAPPRDVTILGEMMVHVLREIPDARLLILHYENDPRFVEYLERRFTELGVHRNVVFGPPVPHEQVYAYIAAADVGISPIEPIPIYNVSSPAKFVEMLGMACPVVASQTPEQKEVIETWQAGICVPYDAEAFAEAIVNLLQNPAQAREFGRRGRRFVESERAYSHLADTVEGAFRMLAGHFS